MRKDFTQSERVAIAKAIELELGERRGRPPKENSSNCDELKDKRSDEIAGKKAGFGSKETYRQAKKVVEEGTPDLVNAMDEGRVKPSVASQIKEKKAKAVSIRNGAPD